MTRRRKQNIKLALVCAILGAIVLMTIFAPWLAPYDPLEVNMELRLLDPCRAHPLGTDALGRDVLSRVIYGGRASLLLAVAGLSYLGLGIEPPTPDWGEMVSGTARRYFRSAPHLLWAPGICIILLTLSINLLGDLLRDRLDVKQDAVKEL